MNVANVEVVRNARLQCETADGTEAVELANGEGTVLVARAGRQKEATAPPPVSRWRRRRRR